MLFRSEHLFKFGVFSLQFFQMPGFVDIHLAKLPLPTVLGHLGDVYLLANLHDAFAAIGTPQDADLIFSGGAFPFHSLVPFMGSRLTLRVT